MKAGPGVAVLLIGLIVLYVALSSKYDCVIGFLNCLFGSEYKDITGKPASVPPNGNIRPSIRIPPIGVGGTAPFVRV